MTGVAVMRIETLWSAKLHCSQITTTNTPTLKSHYRPDVIPLTAQYAPAQACKWWHDIRHVHIWIGHHYCLSNVGCHDDQPKWPGDLDLWPFDLGSGVRVTLTTSVPILVFLGLSVLELRPMYATDRRQTDRCQTKASLNAPAY